MSISSHLVNSVIGGAKKNKKGGFFQVFIILLIILLINAFLVMWSYNLVASKLVSPMSQNPERTSMNIQANPLSYSDAIVLIIFIQCLFG